MIRIQLIKLFCLIIIFSLTSISTTNSWMSDQETSSGNSFAATTLDFSLLTSSLFNSTGVTPGYSENKVVSVKKDGVADFKQIVTFTKTSGDDALCSALQIEARFDGTLKYSGSLASLSVTPETNTGVTDDWTFILSLSDNNPSLQSKSCNFDLKVKGWQTDSDGTWGFSDQEILNNSVSTGTWVLSRSVVINEVMWMGSTSSVDDEWIELKNTTGGAIDLTGWKIDGAGSGSSSITLSGTIPANGYFLVSNHPTSSSAVNNSITADLDSVGMSLDDGGEQLTLRDATNIIIDQTPSGAWAAGENGTDKKSMERDDDPATGWHTCIDTACNGTTYWDSEGDNYGTPKAGNLSGEPRISLYISGDNKSVGFKVFNTNSFRKLTYILTYDTDTISDGVPGSVDLSGEAEFVRDGITLGTCTSGGTCTYHSGVHNIKIKVDLEDNAGVVTTLEQTI